MATPKSVPKPLEACVTWMPFGAGVVSTVGFWWQQEATQTAIAGEQILQGRVRGLDLSVERDFAVDRLFDTQRE